MTWKALVVVVGALASFGAGTNASARGAKASPPPPPVVHRFSPAAVHPGDEFLIDAEFAGPRAPRVWIGRHALPRRGVRVSAGADGSPVRRLWARIPKRMAAGDHVLKIATRSGKAVAGKLLRVASCGAPPVVSTGCGGELADGAALSLTATGYDIDIVNTIAPTIQAEIADPSISYISECGDDGKFRCFTVRLTTVAAAEIHVGEVSTIGIYYYDGQTGSRWIKEPGGNVKVVSASPTRVALCLDTVLTFDGHAPVGTPQTLRLQGPLVISRE